ncbi:hypothetical protein VaNZ11_002548 [Volvox africanus]|uniref:Pherophorin domain-containing protein n=1 Tax=Volvox africanus TaxID=51714 RepID=A0ABQ5RSW1_9CHLO|nr:hypothetical protein VaNZ11_002548 [Volvox africanus]
MEVSNGGDHRGSKSKPCRSLSSWLNIVAVTTLIALLNLSPRCATQLISTDIEVSPVEALPSKPPNDQNLGNVPVAPLQYPAGQQTFSPAEPLLDYPVTPSMPLIASVAAFTAFPTPRPSPRQPRSPPPSPSPSRYPRLPSPPAPRPQPPSPGPPGPQPPSPRPSKPSPPSPPFPPLLKEPRPPPPKPSPPSPRPPSPLPSPTIRRSPPPSPFPPPLPPSPLKRPPHPGPSPPPPFSSIPSPPLSSPPPCTTCVSFSLARPEWQLFEVNFSPDICGSLSENIIQLMYDMAANVNVDVLGVLSASCSDTLMKVCFTFASDEEGGKLQSQAEFFLYIFPGKLLEAFELQGCSAVIDGYVFSLIVGGDGNDPLTDTGCFQYFQSFSCAMPGGSGKPNCTCITQAGTTPFGAQKALTELPGRKTTTVLYCFETAAAFKMSSYHAVVNGNEYDFCNSTTLLRKAEIWADEAQRQAVKGIGVQPSGSPTMRFISPSWGAPGTNVVKANQLNWTLEQADGGRICIELVRGTDLSSFCNTVGRPAICWIYLFDPSGACCPSFPAGLMTAKPPLR